MTQTPADAGPAGKRPHGPLSGYRILELAGLGALPYGTMKLADMGADVIRINRVSEAPAGSQAPGSIGPDRRSCGANSTAAGVRSPST